MMDLGLSLGDSDPVIVEAKRFLGEFDLSDIYTEEFGARVRGFQTLTGLEPDGFLDGETLKKMGLRRP